MLQLKYCKLTCNPINAFNVTYEISVCLRCIIVISHSWMACLFLQEPSFLESAAKDDPVQRQESIRCAVVAQRQSNWVRIATGHLGCHTTSEEERYITLFATILFLIL